jgi:hypothetical protein
MTNVGDNYNINLINSYFHFHNVLPLLKAVLHS